MPTGCQCCQLKIQEKQKLCISAQPWSRQWHCSGTGHEDNLVRRWVGAVDGLKWALGAVGCPPVLAPACLHPRGAGPWAPALPVGTGTCWWLAGRWTPSARSPHRSSELRAISCYQQPASTPRKAWTKSTVSCCRFSLISFLSYNAVLTLDFTSDFHRWILRE